MLIEIDWYEDINPEEVVRAKLDTPFGWEFAGNSIYVYGKPREPYGYAPGEKFWYARVLVEDVQREAKKNGVPVEDYLQALVQLAEVRFHSKWTT